MPAKLARARQAATPLLRPCLGKSPAVAGSASGQSPESMLKSSRPRWSSHWPAGDSIRSGQGSRQRRGRTRGRHACKRGRQACGQAGRQAERARPSCVASALAPALAAGPGCRPWLHTCGARQRVPPRCPCLSRGRAGPAPRSAPACCAGCRRARHPRPRCQHPGGGVGRGGVGGGGGRGARQWTPLLLLASADPGHARQNQPRNSHQPAMWPSIRGVERQRLTTAQACIA